MKRADITLIDGRTAVCLIGMIALLTPALCRAQGYTISTVAGGVPFGTGCAQETDLEGDGCPATSAGIGPAGIAIDSAGNIYIADSGNNLIRKVSTNGIISAIAGNVNNIDGGYSGDGGPATGAEVRNPAGLALDTSGNLYIADSGNNRIRKIATNGIITTVAGGGSGCAQSTNLEGDGCPATSAGLFTPSAVAVDAAGNIYIADTFFQRIRKVALSGTITTVAGNGSYTLLVSSLGDGGPATSATLNFPTGVAVDSSGNIYIGDTFNNRIRKVTVNGIINTIAGTGSGSYSGDGGPATRAGLSGPNGITVDAGGNLYIADTGDQRVRAVTASGTITTIAGNGDIGGTGDGGPATGATLNGPVAVALGNSGDIFVSDAGTSPGTSSLDDSRVRLLTPSSQVTGTSPAVNPGGVVSASAFGEFTSISPGSWIEIYGSNLAATTQSWTQADFNGANAPTSLGGTSVTIGGQSAFIDFISPGQVNALVPSHVTTGVQQIILTAGGVASNPVTVTINAVQPGLLAPPSFNVNGTQYAVATFGDGSYVLPTGAISGITSRPAQPGNEIVLYGVGFGPVTPAIPAGQLVQQSNTLQSSFQISLGGIAAQPAYDGLAPNYTGLYQFNITVPEIPAGNAVPFTFTVDGVAGSQTLYIAVGN